MKGFEPSTYSLEGLSGAMLCHPIQARLHGHNDQNGGASFKYFYFWLVKRYLSAMSFPLTNWYNLNEVALGLLLPE